MCNTGNTKELSVLKVGDAKYTLVSGTGKKARSVTERAGEACLFFGLR
jgi:hypothetical protein